MPSKYPTPNPLEKCQIREAAFEVMLEFSQGIRPGESQFGFSCSKLIETVAPHFIRPIGGGQSSAYPGLYSWLNSQVTKGNLEKHGTMPIYFRATSKAVAERQAAMDDAAANGKVFQKASTVVPPPALLPAPVTPPVIVADQSNQDDSNAREDVPVLTEREQELQDRMMERHFTFVDTCIERLKSGPPMTKTEYKTAAMVARMLGMEWGK